LLTTYAEETLLAVNLGIVPISSYKLVSRQTS